MDGLPQRGSGVRNLGLTLPPDVMPARDGLRPLKQWRYLGVYTPELMACVGDARIGPAHQRWWAVALPDGQISERTTIGRGGVELSASRARVRAKGVELDLEIGEGEPVETASSAGDSYIWTAKQANVGVRGTLTYDGAELAIDGPCGFIDESAGYHERHTMWKWSAGVGVTPDGTPVGWNLVTGIHDSPRASERSVWVGGEPREPGRVDFADDLSAITFGDGSVLHFTEWAAREENANLLLIRSRYRQPFGSFHGELEGGLVLDRGWGVMEEHEVWW